MRKFIQLMASVSLIAVASACRYHSPSDVPTAEATAEASDVVVIDEPDSVQPKAGETPK